MSKMILKRSKTSEYRTPKWLFDMFNDRYKFDLDAAASKENALCKRYCTKESPFQSENPEAIVDCQGAIFCNPPYDVKSLDSFADFIVRCTKLAYEERRHIVIVFLVPCKTDQDWWFQACQYCTELYFIKGRLKFSDTKDAAQQSHAVFVFDSNYPYHCRVQFINQPRVK